MTAAGVLYLAVWLAGEDELFLYLGIVLLAIAGLSIVARLRRMAASKAADHDPQPGSASLGEEEKWRRYYEGGAGRPGSPADEDASHLDKPDAGQVGAARRQQAPDEKGWYPGRPEPDWVNTYRRRHTRDDKA
jgi:hypothetical protein